MELNGKPFIPPTCPAEQNGNPISPSPDNFHFIAFDEDYKATPESESVTAIVGYFGEVLGSEPEEDGSHIGLDIVQVPQHSDEARQAHEIYNSEETIRRVGAMFCERVINCRGVVNGECWALGTRAVMQVVREVGQANS